MCLVLGKAVASLMCRGKVVDFHALHLKDSPCCLLLPVTESLPGWFSHFPSPLEPMLILVLLS